MTTQTVEMVECVCENCKHVWITRNKNVLPKVCSHCKSFKWNKSETI